LRILPNTLHAKFADEFRVIKREFDEAADDFARDYPVFVEERKRELNGLFNEGDYPAPGDIRAKFRLKIKPYPVPEADDFRSDTLDDDTLDDIRRELMDAHADAATAVTQDTVKQIVDVVGHMSEKLKAYTGGQPGDDDEDRSKPKNFFTDSLVGNVRSLAELLPHFNLHDDPKLKKIIGRIQRELCVEEAATLRENEKARAVVQKSADDILRDVNALLG
jgi:hypothetical protein